MKRKIILLSDLDKYVPSPHIKNLYCEICKKTFKDKEVYEEHLKVRLIADAKYAQLI